MPRSTVEITQENASGGVSERLAAVRRRIAEAEARYGRSPGSVRLLAVSKAKPAEDIRAAHAAGQRATGENYVQEALAKMEALADLDIEWHFIGPVQANKTRAIAEHFDWVQSVDRLKIARRLNEQRDASAPPLDVCVQANVSGERTKAGAALEDAPALARAVAGLPRLRLRGLMSIPAPAEGFEAQRLAFRRLRELFEALNEQGLGLDTLSMGMTADLEAAVAEGATLVRVGTAIFGERARR